MNTQHRLVAILTVAALSISLSVDLAANRRDYIRIVGSSIIYPFAKAVAAQFGNGSDNSRPDIQSTGSRSGLQLFCAGVGPDYPDIANASRRMKAAELQHCIDNGVDDVVEVLIGYDGIVLANTIGAFHYALNRTKIFLALARDIPNPDCDLLEHPEPHQTCLIPNPYQTWKQINPILPDIRIQVLGPPATSGTRDAFAKLALEGGCRHFDWIADMKARYKAAQKAGNQELYQYLKGRYESICHSVRTDGHYVEAGEDDNVIVAHLRDNPDALGVFGYSFLEQHSNTIQGAVIEGHSPTFASIANKRYPISRPLYFYLKKAHIDMVPGLMQYLQEFTSDAAWGSRGYLAGEGMIPLSAEKRSEYADNAARLVTVKKTDFPY